MKEYFSLQLVLINRKIKEAGINPILGYLGSLLVFLLLSEYLFQKTEFAKYMVMLLCISFQIPLSEKNRIEFLQSTFGDEIKNKLRIIENLILCIPFVSLLLFKSYIFEGSILFLFSLVSALFSFKPDYTLTIPTPFFKRPFEFSTGFRNTFYFFPVAYALTVIAILFDNLNLGIFSFLLIFLTSISYFPKPEHEYYVWVHAETPKLFLRNKILNASKNVTALVTPILISLLIYYPSNYKLIIILYVLGLLFLWTIILAKYSSYPQEMNLLEGLAIAISLYFPPFLLAIIPFFYTKSINRLKNILHDKN